LVFGYVLYWTSGDVFGPRYAFEAASALLVLSAAGIQRISRFLAETDSAAPRPSLRRTTLFAGLVVVLALGNLVGYLPWQVKRYRGLYGVTSEPRERLLAAGLENALVIVQDENGWKDYAVAFSMNAPKLDGSVVYANDCGSHNEELLAYYAGRDVFAFDGLAVRPYPGGGGP
jgi:hypothetical protein